MGETITAEHDGGVGMHYDFGIYSQGKISGEDYLTSLRKLSREAPKAVSYYPSVDEIGVMVQLFAVLGAADVLGAHPVALRSQVNREQASFLAQAEAQARYVPLLLAQQPYWKFGIEKNRSKMRELMTLVSSRWAKNR